MLMLWYFLCCFEFDVELALGVILVIFSFDVPSNLSEFAFNICRKLFGILCEGGNTGSQVCTKTLKILFLPQSPVKILLLYKGPFV